MSTKHSNEKTQQYHLVAMQSYKNQGADNEDFGEEEEESKISPENKKRIEQNKKVIMSALRRLTKGKAKGLFVPLTGILFAYDSISATAQKYKERAKTKQEKMMADAYAGAVEEFIDLVPPDDAKWDEETLKRVSEGIKQKAEDCREVIRQKGKNCPEYAKYRAYRDYASLCDEKMNLIRNRVERERLKEGGRSSRGNRQTRGGQQIPSKDEVMQWAFSQHFKGRPKTNGS